MPNQIIITIDAGLNSLLVEFKPKDTKTLARLRSFFESDKFPALIPNIDPE